MKHQKHQKYQKHQTYQTNPIRAGWITGAARAIAGVVLLGGALSACVPVVVGGAAAVGTMVAVDRRTSGMQLEDESIELRTTNQLYGLFGERAHVNVTSWNRQVLLTGEVALLEDKSRLERTVQGIENVRSIVNDVVIAPPSALGERSNDTLITGKVRASLVDAKDVMSNAVKVVTERGVVYLMGRVTEREAQRITQVAREVGGVVKVVRVFEVISEEELRRSFSRPQTAPAASTL